MKFHILICDGPSCGVTHDSDRLVDCARDEIEKSGLDVEIKRFTCFDHCEEGPNVFIRKIALGEKLIDADSALFVFSRGFYQHMSEEKVCRVLCEHCTSGEPVEDLISEF